MSNTLIILPTYNEADNLRPMTERLLAMKPALEVLVVDDNSPDGTGDIADGLAKAAKVAGVAVQLQRIGSMSCCYFANAPVHNMAEAMQSDRDRFGKYFHGMLEEGVYIAPSQFEAGFVSAAHDEAAIEKTVAAASKVMKSL